MFFCPFTGNIEAGHAIRLIFGATKRIVRVATGQEIVNGNKKKTKTDLR